MASILNLALHQLELAGIGNVEGGIGTSPLRQINGELGTLGTGKKAAGRVVRVDGLTGSPELGARGGVLTGVGNELLDLVIRSPKVLKDVYLDPNLGGLAVPSGLLVKLSPTGRFGFGP